MRDQVQQFPMTSDIDASMIVGELFPTDAGARLAEELLKLDRPLDEVTVDLTSCKAVMLISAFFNALLQRIHEAEPSKLTSARRIDWTLAYEFQVRNVHKWMKDFEPV
jgi:hypothetical protein